MCNAIIDACQSILIIYSSAIEIYSYLHNMLLNFHTLNSIGIQQPFSAATKRHTTHKDSPIKLCFFIVRLSIFISLLLSANTPAGHQLVNSLWEICIMMTLWHQGWRDAEMQISTP